MSTLLDFLFPTSCVVCNKPPSLVCDGCLPIAKPRLEMLAGIPLLYALELDGTAESLITGYKDQMKLALAGRLASYLDAAVRELMEPSELLVFPPSSKANFAKRGYNPVEIICKRSSVLQGVKVLTIWRVRQGPDQRGLTAVERQQNLEGAFETKPGKGSVLIVDDVVTTGATALSITRALEHRGFNVSGICAIARRT